MTKAGIAALLLAITCSVGAVSADADTISFLTGSFDYFGSGPMFGTMPLENGMFLVLSLSENCCRKGQPQCDEFGNCDTPFYGAPAGGPNSMFLVENGNTIMTLAAFDMTGSISGDIYTTNGDFDYATQTSCYNFVGFWSNGWMSSVGGCDFANLDAEASRGNLTIATQTTPEPNSIALWGSSILGLIGYGRKRSDIISFLAVGQQL